MAAINFLYDAVSKFEVAFITLFAGLLISRLVGKIVKRMLAETELNKLFAAKGANSISEIIGSSVEGLLYFVTVLIVFKQLGLAKFMIYVFVLLLVILVIYLIFITILQLQNVLAWIKLRSFFNKNIGKVVRIGDMKGELLSVNFLRCQLRGEEFFSVPHEYTLKNNPKKILKD